MKMIRAVVIEDEIIGQKLLLNKLAELFPQIQVVNVIDNLEEARVFFQKQKPEIIFLDIKIKGGNGLDLLQEFAGLAQKTIVTTAYSEFAIRALNQNTAHYLLKPYTNEEFVKAVNKIISAYEKENTGEFLDLGTTGFRRTKDLLYVESKGAYSIFTFLTPPKEVITSKNLGFYEEILPPQFYRIHHSCLINTENIVSIEGSKYVLTPDGKKLPISSRKSKDFLDFLASQK
jgi:two-component system, LytTR family, response regulator